MPFQSEKQRRYLWANEPEIARDWTDTYGSGIAKALGGRIPFANGLDYLKNIGSNVMGGANWLADRASNVMMNQVPNRFLDYMKGTRGPVTNLTEIAPTRSTQDVLMQGIASNIGRKGYDFSNPFSSVIQSTGGGGEHGPGRTVDYAGYKLGNPLEGGWPGSVGELAPYFNMLGGSAENQIANTLGDYTVNYTPKLDPNHPEVMNVSDIYDFRGKAGEGWGTPYDINVNLSPQMIEKIKGQINPRSAFQDDYNYDPSTMAANWNQFDDIETQNLDIPRRQQLARLAAMEQYPTVEEDDDDDDSKPWEFVKGVARTFNPFSKLPFKLRPSALMPQGGIANFANTMRGGLTQRGYEQAREARRHQARIDNMLKRREAGKSYSQKNLESLTGKDEGRGSYTATPTRSISSEGTGVTASSGMHGGKHYNRGGLAWQR